MRFITLKNNKVVAIRQGQSMVEGEIQSDIGELGQILVDGVFVDAPVEPITPQPSIEEQLTEIKEQNLILMDALATVFEEILGGI